MDPFHGVSIKTLQSDCSDEIFNEPDSIFKSVWNHILLLSLQQSEWWLARLCRFYDFGLPQLFLLANTFESLSLWALLELMSQQFETIINCVKQKLIFTPENSSSPSQSETRCYNVRNLISLATYWRFPLLSALDCKNCSGKGCHLLPPAVFYEMLFLLRNCIYKTMEWWDRGKEADKQPFAVNILFFTY